MFLPCICGDEGLMTRIDKHWPLDGASIGRAGLCVNEKIAARYGGKVMICLFYGFCGRRYG